MRKPLMLCIVCQLVLFCLFLLRTFHHSRSTLEEEVLWKDRLSPNQFKTLASYVYGKNPKPSSFPVLTAEVARNLTRVGIPLFVETNQLGDFFTQIHPLIRVPYVLLSGDTDASAPEPYISMVNSPTVAPTAILHWFGMNCNNRDWYEKFTCIPNGIDQWHDGLLHVHQIAQQQHLSFSFPQKQPFSPPHLRVIDILCTFSVQSNRVEREAAHAYFCRDLVKEQVWVDCQFVPDNRRFYHKVVHSKFVVSPHGVGLDCFRTWEALYLGSYVIVKESTLDVLYEELPVWIVKEWSEVTVDGMVAKYEEFVSREYDYRGLYLGYWAEEVRKKGLV